MKRLRILSLILVLAVSLSNVGIYASTDVKEPNKTKEIVQVVRTIKSSSTSKTTATGVTSSGEAYTITVEAALSEAAIIRAYDETYLGLISSAILTSNTTQAKYTLIFGIPPIGLSGQGWLKGTVTGSDNNIYVTYQM